MTRQEKVNQFLDQIQQNWKCTSAIVLHGIVQQRTYSEMWAETGEGYVTIDECRDYFNKK